MKAQIVHLKRMLFGQTALPFESGPEQTTEKQQQALTEKITYTRQKQSRSTHKGQLPLPEHLPVEEVEIHPEGDLSGMVCIGTKVTEELEPAPFYIRWYICYKYAQKIPMPVAYASVSCPSGCSTKGFPGGAAGIHSDRKIRLTPAALPQRQWFLRKGSPIASSTLEGWAAQGMDRLQILWEHLAEDTRARVPVSR